MRQSIVACLVVVALAVLTAPVLAGGWATVRLDEEPGDILAGVPWNVGFVVKQHDVTPTNDVDVVVRAVNTETGEEIMVSGVQNGPSRPLRGRVNPAASRGVEVGNLPGAVRRNLVRDAHRARRRDRRSRSGSPAGATRRPDRRGLRGRRRDGHVPGRRHPRIGRSVGRRPARDQELGRPVAVGSGKIDTPLGRTARR